MYGQSANRNTKGNAKVRRPLLDWYVISRRTFYQVLGIVLAFSFWWEVFTAGSGIRRKLREN
jgi:hypothetical protein